LRQVEALDAEEPTALWYLGIVAARERQAAKARDYWSRLLPKLAPNGEEARLVRSAIDAIEAK
jgi:cytochrome c-type biogenesis protein CcmH/NrfG